MSQPIKPMPATDELKDYQAWVKKDPTITLMLYAQFNATPDLIVAMAKFFYPDFIVYEECIFFQHHSFDVANFNEWKKVLKGDLTQVELVMNHVHIDDLFRNFEKLLSDQNLFYIGNVLFNTWKTALNVSFPERKIKVIAPQSLEEMIEQEDFIITFCQVRD
jgi:hypothetical protein